MFCRKFIVRLQAFPPQGNLAADFVTIGELKSEGCTLFGIMAMELNLHSLLCFTVSVMMHKRVNGHRMRSGASVPKASGNLHTYIPHMSFHALVLNTDCC